MMGHLEWNAYLQECSRQIIDAGEDSGPILPEAATRGGWLGYAPASNSAVRQAEKRLGATLPPSLRAFYSASNGWRTVGGFIYDVLPLEKIGWIRELSLSLWEGAVALEEYYARDERAVSGRMSHGQDTDTGLDYIIVNGQRLPEIGYGQAADSLTETLVWTGSRTASKGCFEMSTKVIFA